MPLEQGDHFKTGAKGFAEILVDDGSQIRLEENSEITLSKLSADSQAKSITASVYVWFGRMPPTSADWPIAGPDSKSRHRCGKTLT